MNGKVWNKYHQQMQNGNFIYGGGWYHERVFLPVPGSDSLLYLFSCCVTLSCPFGLYYTLIDLSANSDSGAIIQKNVPINNSPAFDGLMAIQHGNGRDWWLLYQRWDGSSGNVSYNDFFVYLVDSMGVHLNSQVNVGSNHKTGGGQLCFNNSGEKFSVVTWRNLIQLYNFDRCTGGISLWETVQIENLPPINSYYFSSAFSPDGTKLYVCENSAIDSIPSKLLQFNLQANPIISSKTIIHNFITSTEGIADLKLAPNGKIYLAAEDEINHWIYIDTVYTLINKNLSVINQPDSLGLACDFQPFSFYLGGARTSYGLPNNPDYELGAWVGSPCDTLTTNLTPGPSPEARGEWMQAWYNHEWNMIHVNAAQLKGKKGMLRLFDMEGRVVFEKPAEVIAGGYYTTEINMENLANGVYVVNLVTEQDKISGKVGKY
ncbi:MAG: T9SS type A sorting domain-containing protein [Bacteroidia bacterium]|nr:T9SS type A sorting domain-containing protein [Bacteroidia bacterium]